MKYKNFRIAKDHEWFQPVKKGFLMSCCDCGLVHRMDFRVSVKGRVQFKATRAPKYTAAQRKRLGITVRHPTKQVKDGK